MGDCRAKIRLKRPNPLFERWIEELYLDAMSKSSKSKNQLKVALDSLKKYPLILQSGSECIILRGFGKNLCKILDRKLARHGNIKASNISVTSNILLDKIVQTPSRTTIHTNTSNNSKLKEYVPAFRSGAYALLVTLLSKSQESNYKGYMTKSELIIASQRHCDHSMTMKKPGSFYTAWSSMTSLISKKLVSKVNKGYSLSEYGLKLAMKLQVNTVDNDINIENLPSVTNKNISMHVREQIVSEEPPIIQNNEYEETQIIKKINLKSKNINQEILTPDDSDEEKVEDQYISKVFAPNSFEVILLVDKQETSGSKKDELVRSKLEKFTMIKYESRTLKVGDFVWIARNSVGDEMVLPYIVERKRMDDLGHSIKDGRFHEQKFRLKHCGIPNVVYLVESHGNNQHTGMPLQSLMQAVTNTRIQNGFLTQFAASISDSLKFLAMMTKMLEDKIKDKTLVSCRKDDLVHDEKESDRIKLMLFEDFNIMASKSKTLSVADMFIKQLLQLKGITIQKATAIVAKYESPLNLISAFQDRSLTNEPESLLSNVMWNSSKCNVGPVLRMDEKLNCTGTRF